MAANDFIRRTIKVTCADGDHFSTWINGTIAQIREHYRIGSRIRPGIGPEELFTTVKRLEFLDDQSKADLRAERRRQRRGRRSQPRIRLRSRGKLRRG